MVASMATARGLPTPTVSARRSVRLTLRPMLTTAMLVLAMAMEVTAMAACTATARGLPTLRPMLTTATLVLAMAMEATAMAACMATARGLPTLRPMLTTDTLVLATAMEATVWVTPTASKTACLLPRTTFKGGAASTEIKKKYKKVQFQVSKFLIKNVISSQHRSLIG